MLETCLGSTFYWREERRIGAEEERVGKAPRPLEIKMKERGIRI
jgi:hypothetical protein